MMQRRVNIESRLFWRTLTVFAIVVGVISGASAFAGKEGHGGNAVVCRDGVGKITSAELLDFFEGRVIYGLKIKSSPLPMQIQLHNILNRLASSNRDISSYMIPLFRDVNNNKKVLEDGVALTPVDDAFPTVIPANCKIEQLANYVNDEEILIDGAIWKALNVTNQVGLIVHESLYKFLRSFGETDSRRTRRIVAHLFSDYIFNDVYEKIPTPSQLCQSEYDEHYYKFFVYPTNVQDQNGIHQEPQAQFIWIDGQPQFSKKTALVATIDSSFPSVGSGWSITQTSFEKGDVINFDFTPLDHGNIRMEVSGTSGVNPSRKYAKNKFSCQSYPITTPGPQPQAGLSASAVPKDPILIPNGSTNLDSYFNLSGPYFILNQLQILWAGVGQLQLDSIGLKSLDPKITIACVFRGDDLKILYPDNVSNEGKVYFNQGTPAQASQPLGCQVTGGIPNTFQSTYDIPVEIEINGSVFGPNGYVGPSTTTTTIHVN